MKAKMTGKSSCRVGQTGFTLLEVLIAMGIAAAALVVLLQRIGVSSDTQLTLASQAVALEVAVDVLERGRLQQPFLASEQQGEAEVRGTLLTWRTTVEETQVEGFIRQNIEVAAPGELPLKLFLYRSVP